MLHRADVTLRRRVKDVTDEEVALRMPDWQQRSIIHTRSFDTSHTGRLLRHFTHRQSGKRHFTHIQTTLYTRINDTLHTAFLTKCIILFVKNIILIAVTLYNTYLTLNPWPCLSFRAFPAGSAEEEQQQLHASSTASRLLPLRSSRAKLMRSARGSWANSGLSSAGREVDFALPVISSLSDI